MGRRQTYIIPNPPYLQILITLFLRFILARWLPFVLMTRRLQFIDEPFYTAPETTFNENKREYMRILRSQEHESHQN